MSFLLLIPKLLLWVVVTLVGALVGFLVFLSPAGSVFEAFNQALGAIPVLSNLAKVDPAAWAGGLGGGLGSWVFTRLLGSR